MTIIRVFVNSERLGMGRMEGAWLTALVILVAFSNFGRCGFGESDGGSQTFFDTTNDDLDDSSSLDVRMYFAGNCEAKINKQIAEELKASHIYLSMAYYFARNSVALFGFHKFFKQMSDEERQHGQMLMEYLNKRGGITRLSSSLTFTYASELGSGDWRSAMFAMQSAMRLERAVNKHLVEEVHKCAIDTQDAHLQDYIESNFLTEQVDSMKQIGDYLTKMERLGTGVGLHMFDQELLK